MFDLERFFFSSQDLMCIAGMDGFFKRVNSAFSETLGYTEVELLSRPYAEFVHPDDLEGTRAEAAKLASGIPCIFFENRYYCRDGSVRWLAWKCTPVEDLIYAVARDVTERKITEAALAIAEKSSRESARLKSEFLANMSHEIRTPLNAVLGMAGLLTGSELTPDQRESVDIIRQSADHLLVIVNDILDFSKIEAGRFELEILDFDLEDTVSEVKRVLDHSARTKGIALTVETDLRGPTEYKGDPGRIKQVLFNLVQNAIKFTREGSVRLRVRSLGLGTGPGAAREKLRIEVADTGIGMSEETLKRVFDVFTQADASTTRKYGGTGLGLSISRRLVELMDGRIGVTSKEGDGALFWFELALERGEMHERRKVDRRVFVESSVRGRILVGEDHSINQKVIRRIIERFGHQVDVVGSGREVLAAARNVPYDVIFMDCHMPDMDGYEATTEIRHDPVLGPKNIPIIALTADVLKDTRDRCLAAGMNDYVTKPVEPEIIRRVILQYFRKSAEGEKIIDYQAIDKLRELNGEGQPDLAAELIGDFLSKTPDALTKLNRMHSRGDFKGLEDGSHSLKSVAAMIGAREVAQICAKLEELARIRSIRATRGYLDDLTEAFRDARDHLVAFLGQSTEASAA